MLTRTFLPAIASLAFLSATSAFAQSAVGPVRGSGFEKPASVVVLAAAQKKYQCRKYANFHERGRCREIHGIPDDVN